MAKTIPFTVDDEKYVLEYTLDSAARMEDEGFNPSDLDDIVRKPVSVVLRLVYGAFTAHHPDITKDKVVEIFSKLANKSELIGILAQMYQETVTVLFDEEEDNSKNVKWSVVE